MDKQTLPDWTAEKAEAMRCALEHLAGDNETLCDIIAGLDEIVQENRNSPR